jgi:hypothetical protein
MDYEIKNSTVYGKILYKDGRPVIVNYDTADKLAERFRGTLIKVYSGRYMIKLPESANSIEECDCGGSDDGIEITGQIMPDTYSQEPDHEVQMARQEVYRTAKLAIKLHEMLKQVGEQQGLEGWVQRKLTRAADYIETVYDYLDYEMRYPSDMMEADEQPAQAPAPAGSDMALKQKNLAMQQQRLQQEEQKKAMGKVKMGRLDASGRPIPNSIKEVPDEQIEMQRKAGLTIVGENASGGASSAGGMAGAIGGGFGNGFLNGGPGTITRAPKKRKKKVSETDIPVKEGETGPKFTGYWKGTDKGKPGKKMVGGGP